MSLHKTFNKDGKVTEIMATDKDAVLAEAAPDLLIALERADVLMGAASPEFVKQAIAKAK